MKPCRRAWPSLPATLLAALLAACGGENGEDGGQVPASTAAAPESGAVSERNSCGLPDFQSAMLEQVNRARAESRLCGTRAFSAVPALAWDERLFAAAAGHADDMARNDYFSHDSLDGRTFSQRITDAGYTWSAVGENIAAGQADITQVVEAWLDSPGHCANIMSTSFTEVAVACVREEGSTYTQYWAMSLGRPR